MNPSGERSAHWLTGRQITLVFMVLMAVLGVLVLTGVLNRWFGFLVISVPLARNLLRHHIGR